MRFPEFAGEWEEVRLKDICTISKGAGISKDQLSIDGTPCILYGELYTKYKSEVVRDVFSRTNICDSNLVRSKANDVIIPSSGESAVDIATARCIPYDGVLLGGDLNIIRLSEQNGIFFSYQLNGARKREIAKVAQGVSVVHLYGENLKNLTVFYPLKAEQDKIARFLSLIDERIATQNKIIAHLESLIKGLSQIIFENNAGWEESTISEVASVVSGGTPDTSIPSFWGGDINWFTPSEIGRAKYVNSSNRTITEKGLKNSSAKLLPPNSLLLSTRATIGECSICQSTCTTNQGFQSLVATHVDYEFLFYFMRTKKSELIKKASGSTFSEISANEVKRLKIFIPTINTQKQIANLLKSVDEKITIETKVLSAYNLQKQTLLQRLFI
ncbi:Type I restriction-modification system, specificity subunit S [Mucinivorans hirudinis]|uniref:Type I restriction-modification system, specificity subunit S n=1 Tax=Mucinivorans hirudinis TaxID=1433126 RepID=A0A060RDJ7_9BACT|nr:Type I restriction-modification system, specificity subunit S [Mucinivorans hirudinis]